MFKWFNRNAKKKELAQQVQKIRLPSKEYIITCSYYGDYFCTEKDALDAIQKLADITKLDKNKFGFIVLNLEELHQGSVE
ncbi:hypothetical protein [Pectinatus frisingensis]|uniref:hypothetical protein n=1 Tax=Pectinatus frisingensis TaxID=865 RepID=UPI0018C821C7|nr:hypothetical protein [Pectinatus frisingensis]